MDCRKAESMVGGYIQNTLSVDELSDFLKHIKECPSCYEELETYFIVYYAMQHLDGEKEDTLYMKKLLELDLKKKEKNVLMRELQRTIARGNFFLIVLGLMVFFGITGLHMNNIIY